MKKIFNIIAFFVALAVCSCSPEEFEGADANGIPTISGRTISITTDQETNTATLTMSGDMTGCYPVWYIDDAVYSILPTATYSSTSAGTHTVTAYLMNRNGMSQAALEGEFTFNQTLVDYTTYFKKLCDKEWRIDYSETGHMGCGESGTDGSNWWTASVNDKAGTGVYENRCSFTHTSSDASAAGTYTFDPGESGTVYVNYGCTLDVLGGGQYTVDTAIPASIQSSTFSIINGQWNDEECLYIQFAAETLLPYIPNDDTYLNPYYRVESLTNTRMALVTDNGSISWRLVFTSRADSGLTEDADDTESSSSSMDWDYDSSDNLWKAVDEGTLFNYVSQWFADDSWSQISDAQYSHSGSEWALTIPAGIGSSQWQGQFAIHTTLGATADQAYDMWLVLEMDNDA